jgi:hypothetical protein
MMSLEQLDKELADATANLRRLYQQSIVDLESDISQEPNRYAREYLMTHLERRRAELAAMG